MSVLPNDVFLVTANGTCFGQRIVLTHHYAATGVAGTPSDTDTVANILTKVSGGGDDVLESAYLACLPPEYTLDYWRCQKVTAVRGAYQQESRNALGTHAAHTEAANQAAIITLRGLLAGRANVSNKHIGPIPVGPTVQDDGMLTAGYKEILALFAVQLLTTLIVTTGTVTLKPCILHPAPVGSYTLLTTNLIGTTVNTMRRRTVGRGI